MAIVTTIATPLAQLEAELEELRARMRDQSESAIADARLALERSKYEGKNHEHRPPVRIRPKRESPF